MAVPDRCWSRVTDAPATALWAVAPEVDVSLVERRRGGCNTASTGQTGFHGSGGLVLLAGRGKRW